MERLFKMMYGEFEFDELQSSSFPALSVLLFMAYTFLVLVAVLHGASRRHSPTVYIRMAKRHMEGCAWLHSAD
jgi:hypothetical protein